MPSFNITNLTVSTLHLSMCGASQLATSLFKEITQSFVFPNILHVGFTVSIFLLNITNLTATMLGISHSRGVGLLGGNIFGVSSIQQAVFVNNTPNCVIVFLDSYSPVEAPVLYLTDSLFMLGTVRGYGYTYYGFAGGLSIIAVQTMYHVKCYTENVTSYGNTGSTYGNMYFSINCKVAIQVTRVNLTGGHHNGLVLDFNGGSTNCSSIDARRRFYISHSYFGRNTIGATLYIKYSVWLGLKNITVENNSKIFDVFLTHHSVFTMENANITHNTGQLQINSLGKSTTVEFYGSNTFAYNNCKESVYSVLHLMQGNAIFHGNTTFLQNKGRYGGAICADDVDINFQGNIRFLDNEGE